LEAFTLQKYCVLLDNGPAWSEVPVTVESSTSDVAKFVEVDNCTRYLVAPWDAFQFNVRVTGWSPALFAGEERVGMGGATTIVVKLQVGEYWLVPPAFEAHTLQ